MAITAVAACSWMTDESAELALLTAWTNDLQSHMMIAQAHDEMEDSHLMASERAAFSAFNELLRVNADACHSWTSSS